MGIQRLPEVRASGVSLFLCNEGASFQCESPGEALPVPGVIDVDAFAALDGIRPVIPAFDPKGISRKVCPVEGFIKAHCLRQAPGTGGQKLHLVCMASFLHKIDSIQRFKCS